MTASEVSATEPDWHREQPERFWDPGRKLLRSIRGYQRWNARRGPIAWLVKRTYVLRHRFWSVVTAADIPINTQIGGGLLLTHPTGVVVHPTAKIGVNCLLFQQVTLVENVVVGGHVDIGAGAKILRPVHIGNHAQIGGNAVVLHDVPERGIAVGIPARVLDRAVQSSS